MDDMKRQRLEAAGWKIGNTSDFLELSPEEAYIIELKLFLSHKLKELRTSHNITQSELAAQMKSSQSRIAKIEAGDPSVSLDWLIRGLFCVGATIHIDAEPQINSSAIPDAPISTLIW